jgi:hypothetical protein
MAEGQSDASLASPPPRPLSLKHWRQLSDDEFQLLVSPVRARLPPPHPPPSPQLSSRFESPPAAPLESHAQQHSSPRPDLPRSHASPTASSLPPTPSSAKPPKSTAYSPSLASTARKPAASTRATKRADVPVATPPPPLHPSVAAMREREQERLRRREDVSYWRGGA